MRKILKIFQILAIFVFAVFSTSCSTLKITPEIEESVNLYINAVSKAEEEKSGRIRVVSIIDDDAIEHKVTNTTIDFEYNVNDGKVSFERYDTLNGSDAEKYKCDGYRIEVYDDKKDSWVDDTENNKDYLKSDTNPLTSLRLFRVDSKKKINYSHFTDITQTVENNYTVITFTLKNDSVSTVLSYTKAKGVVRESAGHTRSYYLDAAGNLCKIQIDASQNIISNGESNKYKTSITVVIER